MSTSPLNSQSQSSSQSQQQQKPLHNFSLSFLKWNTNNTTIHRSRRSSEPHPVVQEHHHAAAAAATEPGSSSASASTSRFNKTRSNLSSLDEIKPPHQKELFQEQEEKKEQEEEEPYKPWNLRPRKANNNNNNNNDKKNGDLGGKEVGVQEECATGVRSTRLRGLLADEAKKKKEKEKKEKSRFSISLTKEEIEEDIFAMAGLKPSRRPKKRSKAVQKQLDACFPGLWLVGTTPDSYRIPDAPPKK